MSDILNLSFQELPPGTIVEIPVTMEKDCFISNPSIHVLFELCRFLKLKVKAVRAFKDIGCVIRRSESKRT